MKKRRMKKGQVYGLNAFLFALAIAIILVVAMLGTTKEFSNKAKAGTYRISSLVSMRSAEQIKSIVDQERRYAFDKALYVTAAFGGYTVFEDMIGVSNCNLPGCGSTCSSLGVDYTTCSSSSASGCPSGTCCIPTGSGSCTSGTCRSPLDLCYPAISDNSGTSCGVKKADADYLTDKLIPYWRTMSGTICIPSLSDVTKTVIDYASGPYSIASEIITNAINFVSKKSASLNFVLNIKSFSSSYTETVWYPIGNTKLRIDVPPEDPISSYIFSPFVHSYPQTKFFGLYEESKAFVEEAKLNAYFMNENLTGIIPQLIDEHYLTLVKNESGVFPQNDPATNESFKSLVRYFKSVSANYPDHPDGPAYCATAIDPALVSPNYPGYCTANMSKQAGGSVKITSWDGKCNTGSPDKDDQAIMCIMWKIAERTNIDLNLRGTDSNWKPNNPSGTPSELGWNFDMNWLKLTYRGSGITNGTTSKTFRYNTTTGSATDCLNCNDSSIINGYKYTAGDLEIGANYIDCHHILLGRFFCRVQPTVKFSSSAAEIHAPKTYGTVKVQMKAEDSLDNYKNMGEPIWVQFNKTNTLASTGWIDYTVHEWMFGYRHMKFCITTPYPGDINESSTENCKIFSMQKDASNPYIPWTLGNIVNSSGTYQDPCGDGNCVGSIGENSSSCVIDCHCGPSPDGDNSCNLNYTWTDTEGIRPHETGQYKTDENFGNCPQDCQTCGNDICDAGENYTNCAHDCYTQIPAPTNFRIFGCDADNSHGEITGTLYLVWNATWQHYIPAETQSWSSTFNVYTQLEEGNKTFLGMVPSETIQRFLWHFHDADEDDMYSFFVHAVYDGYESPNAAIISHKQLDSICPQCFESGVGYLCAVDAEDAEDNGNDKCCSENCEYTWVDVYPWSPGYSWICVGD